MEHYKALKRTLEQAENNGAGYIKIKTEDLMRIVEEVDAMIYHEEQEKKKAAKAVRRTKKDDSERVSATVQKAKK